MVEIKNAQYWDSLSKKGEAEGKLSSQLETLLYELQEKEPDSIFMQESDDYIKNFQNEIDEKLTQIFDQFQDFSPEELHFQRNKFLTILKEHLILIHKKLAMAEISFDAFHLFKFFEALSSITDEVKFRIDKDHLYVNLMDPSRISLAKVKFIDSSFKFYQAGGIALNLKDLAELLKCLKGDESTATLLFGKEQLFITIHSQKYSSTIHRSLHGLDLDPSEIPLENLLSIEYCFEFSLTQAQFIYSLKNLEKYSEIVDVVCTPELSKFQETGNLGMGEIIWTKDQIADLNIDYNQLESEFKEEQESLLAGEQIIASFSITFFKIVGKIAHILEEKNLIRLAFKPDHPMRAELHLSHLGNTSMKVFLAPRDPQYNDENTSNDLNEEEF